MSSSYEQDDDYVNIARRAESYAETGGKWERDLKLISNSPQLMALSEANSKRRCQYCGTPTPGEMDTERGLNPYKQHLQEGCPRYNALMQEKQSGDVAMRSLHDAGVDLKWMGERLRELSIDIRRRVVDIIEIDKRFGEPGHVVCTSIDSYNRTYDFGRLHAHRVGVTNGTGTSRYPDRWVINDSSLAEEDGVTRIHERRHISRECDERLQQLRKEFPEIMSQIDLDLQSAFGAVEQKQPYEGRSKRK